MFKLEQPIQAIRQIKRGKHTEPQGYLIHAIDMPDVITVGMMRQTRSNLNTQRYEYAAEVVAACSGLSIAKVKRMTESDCFKYLKQVVDRVRITDAEAKSKAKRLNNLLPKKYEPRNLLKVKTDTDYQVVEWCAQALEYCGKMKRKEIDRMDFKDFTVLMPLIKTLEVRPKRAWLNFRASNKQAKEYKYEPQ